MIQATEMRCYNTISGISYLDIVINEEVRKTPITTICPYEDLLTTEKKGTLRWYSHLIRSTGHAETDDFRKTTKK